MLLRIARLEGSARHGRRDVRPGGRRSSARRRIPDAMPRCRSWRRPRPSSSASLTQVEAVEIAAVRARLGHARHHRPRRPVPVLDEPLVAGRRRGRSGGSSRFCWPGPALPTAQQSSAVRHCTLVSWSYVCPVAATGDDGPRRAVPLLDEVVEVEARASAGRIPDGDAVRSRRCSSRSAGSRRRRRHRSGSDWARSTRRCRSSSR